MVTTNAGLLRERKFEEVLFEKDGNQYQHGNVITCTSAQIILIGVCLCGGCRKGLERNRTSKIGRHEQIKCV